MIKQSFIVMFAIGILCNSVSANVDDNARVAQEIRDRMSSANHKHELFNQNSAWFPDPRLIEKFMFEQLPEGWKIIGPHFDGAPGRDYDEGMVSYPHKTGWVVDPQGLPRISFALYIGNVAHDWPPFLRISMLDLERAQRIKSASEGHDSKHLVDLLTRDREETVPSFARQLGCWTSEVDADGTFVCLPYEGVRELTLPNVRNCESVEREHAGTWAESLRCVGNKATELRE